MSKKLLILSIMTIALLVVGTGFVSSQETIENEGGSEGLKCCTGTRFYGTKGDKALITPEFLEDDEVIAKIAEHNGMTIEEVKGAIAEHKERVEKFSEKRRGHIKGKQGNMDVGEKIEKMLENEDFLNKVAERHGVSPDELRSWFESSPFLDKR